MKALGLNRPWNNRPGATVAAGLDPVSAERFNSVIPGVSLKADYIRSPGRKAPPSDVSSPHLSKSAPDLLSPKAPDAVWMQSSSPGKALRVFPQSARPPFKAKPPVPGEKAKAVTCERGTSPGIPGSEQAQADALTTGEL